MPRSTRSPRAQLRAAAVRGSELFERDDRSEHLERGGGLAAAIRQMRDHLCAVVEALDRESDRVLGNPRGAQARGHGLGNLRERHHGHANEEAEH
jgi:hypothetical protein